MKRILTALTLVVLSLLSPFPSGLAADDQVKLGEPLKFHDEWVEITDAGTLRRRYKVRVDYDGEAAT